MPGSDVRLDLPPMTFDEFLDWEPEDPDDPGKWELVGGVLVYLMAEGDPHVFAKTGLMAELTRRFPPGRPCRPAGDGKKLFVDDLTGLVPDASIHCRDPKTGTEAPRVVFEVAVTSLKRDLGDKRALFFHNPHVEHYVVLDVNERAVWAWRRGSLERLRADEALILDLDGETIRLDAAAFWAYL